MSAKQIPPNPPLSKRGKYASPAQATADHLLAEIREAEQELERVQLDASAALKAAAKAWASRLEYQRGRVDFLDEKIKALMKEHQADFFAVDGLGSCSLDLPHGALLYDKTDYVVKPRKVDVLAALSRYGFEEAIRRTAAVDWEALDDKEEWPDAALAIIGTRREIKETFAYEISPSPQPSPLKGEGGKQGA
jgi:phage host-nuclease inhibitor protein Gam